MSEMIKQWSKIFTEKKSLNVFKSLVDLGPDQQYKRDYLIERLQFYTLLYAMPEANKAKITSQLTDEFKKIFDLHEADNVDLHQIARGHDGIDNDLLTAAQQAQDAVRPQAGLGGP